jgi:outer membrane protein assembly factor BamB
MLMLLAAASAWGAAGWRGDGTGQFPDAHPPEEWSTDDGTNILWQTQVGAGQSCPIVAGDKVFVTAEEDLLFCLDRRNGKVLWKKNNGYAALPPEIEAPAKKPPTAVGCGYGTASPVTDGNCVYVSYGTGVVACYGLDGTRRWVRCITLPLVNQYGRSASPVLVDGTLIVSIGGLVALEAGTGKTLWRNTQAKPAYGTPFVTRIADVPVLLTPNGDAVRVSDGHILASKLAAAVYSSPVVHQGVAYYVGPPAVAVRLPAKLDEPVRFEKLWQNDEVEGEVFASPLYDDGLLYCLGNQGVLYVLDARTGKAVVKKELDIRSAGGKPGAEPANLYASPTRVGRCIMIANDVGESLLLSPGRECKEVARNFLEKGSGASPLPDGKMLLLRGGKKVYAIAATRPATGQAR